MTRVVVSNRARTDLEEIWQFVAADNPGAADRLLADIESRVRMLATSPRLGRSRDDIAVGFRAFPVGAYLILYQVQPDAIGIVRVIHSARRLVDALQVVDDQTP